MFIPFMGVGIIGAWASFLASLQDGGSSLVVEKETPASRLIEKHRKLLQRISEALR